MLPPINLYWHNLPDITRITQLIPLQMNGVILFLYGNNSYPVYSNQTFINQGKPGSTLAGLQIDNIPVAVADNYTFTNLTKDHSIHVNGGPKPGQVHIFFQCLFPVWADAPIGNLQ